MAGTSAETKWGAIAQVQAKQLNAAVPPGGVVESKGVLEFRLGRLERRDAKMGMGESLEAAVLRERIRLLEKAAGISVRVSPTPARATAAPAAPRLTPAQLARGIEAVEADIETQAWARARAKVLGLAG